MKLKKASTAKLWFGSIFLITGIAMIAASFVIKLSRPNSNSGGRGNDNTIAALVLFGMGALFVALIGVLMVQTMKKTALNKRLVREGEQFIATITGVDIDNSITINGRSPDKVVCEVIDPFTGNKYLYSSDGYMNSLSYMIGMTVTVYVDPNDKSVYFVDLSTVSGTGDYGENKVYDFR